MIRATTPTHTFTFKEIDPSELSVLNVYYAQRGEILLTKYIGDFEFSSEVVDDETIYIAETTLTQNETKLFNEHYKVEVQMRALTQTGEALATPKWVVPVHDVLNDEELI